MKNSAKKDPAELERLAQKSRDAAAATIGTLQAAHARVAAELELMAQEAGEH